ERLLLAGGPAEDVRQALTSAQDTYDRGEALTQAVADARQARDEAMAYLPGCAVYLNAAANPAPADERDWAAAAQEATDLAAALARPPDAAPVPVPDLRGTTQRLTRLTTAVRDRL